MNAKRITLTLVLVALFSLFITPVMAQDTEPAAPVTTTYYFTRDGSNVQESVTMLQGFDPTEFGGNDDNCRIPNNGEIEYVHIGEVVSSPNEDCLSVIEWSLKNGEETVLAGTYALAPNEWFYIPLAVGGVNDQVRVVGTLYRLPQDWNSHMMSVFLAADRDLRDGTTSVVGLSPTDQWVLWNIDQLTGRNGSASSQVQGNDTSNSADTTATSQDAARSAACSQAGATGYLFNNVMYSCNTATETKEQAELRFCVDGATTYVYEQVQFACPVVVSTSTNTFNLNNFVPSNFVLDMGLLFSVIGWVLLAILFYKWGRSLLTRHYLWAIFWLFPMGFVGLFLMNPLFWAIFCFFLLVLTVVMWLFGDWFRDARDDARARWDAMLAEREIQAEAARRERDERIARFRASRGAQNATDEHPFVEE